MSKVVYLLMVLPFILIFGVLILVLALKDNAAQKKLLETVNDEEKERLKKETFEKEEKGKLYVTNGLVADIKEKGEKATVYFMFYNGARDEFYNQPIGVKTSELSDKGITKGAFVPCLMKFDEDYESYELKRIK